MIFTLLIRIHSKLHFRAKIIMFFLGHLVNNF